MKKLFYITLTLLILDIDILIFFFASHYYKIELIGDKEVDIEVNNKYEDFGVKVTDKGKVIEDYQTINNVNDKKTGTYDVIYKVGNIEEDRVVHVVDTEKPVIKLKKRNYYIKGSDFNMSDYIEVTDNYDKDLISNVKLSESFNKEVIGSYNVTYTVKDSNNNEASIESKIDVQNKDTNGIPVLMYHWFYDDTKGEKPGEKNSHNYIAKTEFEKQLIYLKDSNYYFPTWQELIDYIDNKIDLPEKSVVLTGRQGKL